MTALLASGDAGITAVAMKRVLSMTLAKPAEPAAVTVIDFLGGVVLP